MSNRLRGSLTRKASHEDPVVRRAGASTSFSGLRFYWGWCAFTLVLSESDVGVPHSSGILIRP